MSLKPWNMVRTAARWGTEEDASRKSIVELGLESVRTDISNLTSARISIVAKRATISSIPGGLCPEQRHGLHRHGDNRFYTRLGRNADGRQYAEYRKKADRSGYHRSAGCVSVSARNVMLLTDFKDLGLYDTHRIPSKSVLDLFKPRLHIVNVDHEHYVQVTEEYEAERIKLEASLADFKPEFYFIRLFDFMDAINQFVCR
jgi:hypothetical protein